MEEKDIELNEEIIKEYKDLVFFRFPTMIAMVVQVIMYFSMYAVSDYSMTTSYQVCDIVSKIWLLFVAYKKIL